MTNRSTTSSVSTVPVERTLEGVRAGRDELLEKAPEVIGAVDGE